MVATLRSRREPIAGWGNFPVEECTVYRPERTAELLETVLHAPEPTLISRGNGRSYGDASLNGAGAVVRTERLARMLAFDAETGVLHCEAAVSLAEIIDCLLPRGFFLPITPGTKNITVGGAVAADVHGKNHHRDGTICSQLIDLHLLTADGRVLVCSREENADLFWATVGGMGLTGVILDARLRLRPVETAYVAGTTERAANLDVAIQRIVDSDRDYAYAVAWIDCLARGRSLGRSVLLRANPAPLEALPEKLRATPLTISPSTWLNVPFNLPSFTLNSFTMGLFNSAFYWAHRNSESITNYESYFYPLDAVRHWNRIYGRRGVLQYQLVVPYETASEALREVLERVAATGRASFLAVLKSTGPADDGLLSFPIPGLSLALDFAYTGPELLELLHELDAIVLRAGGRVYLAKDACVHPEHFEAMYPNLDRFKEIKTKHDPEQRFSSSLARRLGIVEPG